MLRSKLRLSSNFIICIMIFFRYKIMMIQSIGLYNNFLLLPIQLLNFFSQILNTSISPSSIALRHTNKIVTVLVLNSRKFNAFLLLTANRMPTVLLRSLRLIIPNPWTSNHILPLYTASIICLYSQPKLLLLLIIIQCSLCTVWVNIIL